MAESPEHAARWGAPLSSDDAGENTSAGMERSKKPHPVPRGSYYLPGDLEAQINAFVAYYNHRRYRRASTRSYPGRRLLRTQVGEPSCWKRERMETRSRQKPSVNSQQASRMTSIQDAPELSLNRAAFCTTKSLTTDRSSIKSRSELQKPPSRLERALPATMSAMYSPRARWA